MKRGRPINRGARRAVLLAFVGVATTAAVGCTGRRTQPAPRGGVADLSALVRLHPGWDRVRDLDEKIGRLKAAPSDAGPPFTTPPPAQLERVDPHQTAVESEQRARMAEVIAQRVARDLEAQREELERRLERDRRALLARALAEADDQAQRAWERFARDYDAVARRDADEIGRLTLREILFQPSPTDLLFYPPEERQQRVEERARVERRLAEILARQQEDLQAIQQAVDRDVEQLRRLARERAEGTAREEKLRALAELEGRGRTQQVALQADLERALRPELFEEPAPLRAIPAERQDVAQQVSVLNREASAHVAGTRTAIATALGALQRERAQLASLLEEATRAAVLDVARQEQLSVNLTRGKGDAEVTAWLAAQLRARWVVPRRSGA